MNLKAITNIQRQTGVLSDGHQEVVDQAVAATAAIARLDNQMQKAEERGSTLGLGMHTARALTQLDMLQEQLKAQVARAWRVRDEIEQVKVNLKTV